MSTQAKVGLVGVVLMILLVSVVWNRSDASSDATSLLEREVEQYYNTSSKRAAEISLELMRPYLGEKDQGGFEQRMYSMRDYEVRPWDSYKKIIWAVRGELEGWATRRLFAQGERIVGPQKAWQLAEKEPVYQKLLDLYNGLERLEKIQDELYYSSESRPASMEEVEAVRARFNEQKVVLETLLAEAGK